MSLRSVNCGGQGSSSTENVINTHIFQLSNEVLLMILKYLPTESLFNIFKTCQHFRRLCYENKFWCKIEDPPDDYESMDLIFNTFLTPKTTHIKLSSKIGGINRAHRSSFSPSYLTLVNRTIADGLSGNLNCLTHLSLIRQRIDGRLFTLKSLPGSLKVLNLSGTHLTHISEESSYFKGISVCLENLEELNLSECSWVTSHALLAISKCSQLTRLYLRGCREIGNCIAYVALASRFGFKVLQVLDVTDTMVGSTDVMSFSNIPTLQEFYFGQYDVLDEEEHHIITDQSIAALATSKLLKVIDMSGALATDACVETLMSIPNLTTLHAHFTQLTEVGIARLRSVLPGCDVHKCVAVLAVNPVPEIVDVDSESEPDVELEPEPEPKVGHLLLP